MSPAIDAHAHVVHRRTFLHDRTTSDLFPDDFHVPIAELVNHMSRSGLRRAVLYPTDVGDNYPHWARIKYADRFVVLPVVRSAAEVEDQLSRFVISGVRAVGSASAPTEVLSDARFFQLLANKQLVLSLYLGPHDYTELRRALEKSPDVPILLNHFGFPLKNPKLDHYGRPALAVPELATVRNICSLSEHNNVFVCLSGAYAFSRQEFPYLDILPHLKHIAESFGANRLLWGSDYPFTRALPSTESPKHLVKLVCDNLIRSDLDDQLDQNALALLFVNHDDVAREFWIHEESPDQASIVRLFRDADEYYDTLYPDESNHPIHLEELLSKQSYFVVARSRPANQLVGTAALVPLGATESAELKRMYVVPPVRRSGLGRALLKNVVSHALSRGFTSIRLETGTLQPEAISLYRSAGFREIPAFEPYLPDTNSIFMELRLP